MSAPATNDDVAGISDQWRAEIRRVNRQTLVRLTVLLSILNGITFTAYAAVLKS